MGNQPGEAGEWGETYAEIERMIRAGDLAQAHRMLYALLKRDIQSAEYWQLLVWTAPSQEAAKAFYEHLVGWFPEHPAARGKMQWSGKAWGKRGVDGTAAGLPGEMARPKQSQTETAYTPAALAGGRAQQWDKAYQEIRSAIRAGDLEWANHLVRRAMEREEHNPDLWLLLVWTASKLTSAEHIYQIFKVKFPDYPVAWVGVPWSGKEWGEAKQWRKAANSKAHQKKRDKARAVRVGAAGQGGLDVITNTQVGDNPLEALWVVRYRLAGRLVSNFTSALAVYMVGITVAEVVTSFGSPRLGLMIHGGLLMLILLHTGLGAAPNQRKFLLALALAPLIRLMSLSMPLLNFDYMYWYMVIGVPLMIAAGVVYRLSGYQPKQVGLRLGRWRYLPLQLLVAMGGVGLGYLEYYILKPAPLATSFSLQDLWVPALILLVFTGFLEELIFRGLMQRGAVGILKQSGLWYISLLFAVLHIGYKSWVDLIFVFLVGLTFSWVVKLTRSLFGVTLAHALTNICLFLVFPFLLAAPVQGEVPVQGGVVVQGEVAPITEAVQTPISGPAMWSHPVSEPVLEDTPTATPTRSATPTLTSTPPRTAVTPASATPTPSLTATRRNTRTPTPTETRDRASATSPTPTVTAIPSLTATTTLTALPTRTPTEVPTDIPPDEPTATLVIPTDLPPDEPTPYP